MASPAPLLSVVVRDGVHRVVTRASVAAGAVLMEADGDTIPGPTRHSVQVGEGVHLTLPAHVSPHREPERYGWRYLNHSCAPTAAWRGRLLIALRPLAAGDEVTFDYNTTEWDMATPFRCRCGHCDGRMIRGFAHLDEAARARLLPHAAAHVREHAQ